MAGHPEVELVAHARTVDRRRGLVSTAALRSLIGRWRRRTAPEDGLSLVEMMVAILLIGIILAALASSIIVSLRAVAKNEREVAATALNNQLLEELQTLRWDLAALYEDEAAVLDGVSGTTFEGQELVLLPAAGADRDPLVPEPVVTNTRSDVEYVSQRYVVWVDRNGDGNEDTKRFIVVTTWTDVDGDERDLRAEAERAPTQEEAAQEAAGGLRVLQFVMSPDPADLDAETGENLLAETVFVRLNQGISAAELQYEHRLGGEVMTLIGDQTDPDGSGFVTWIGSIPAGAHTWVNGDADFRFVGTDAFSPGTSVTATNTVAFRAGPFDESGPTPDPSPSPSPDPSTPVEFVTVTFPTICVDNSRQLSRSWEVGALVRGMDALDSVTMEFPYWSASNNTNNPDQAASGVNLDYISGTADSGSTWERSITATDGYRFKKNRTIEVILRATRSSDGANASVTTTVSISSC